MTDTVHVSIPPQITWQDYPIYTQVGSNFNVVVAADPFYGPDSPVVLVTANDFKAKVVDQCNIVIVQFYAPWCPPCKTLKPEFEKAAAALKGVVTLAAIDASAPENAAVGKEYPFPGYPTCKLFVPGKPPSDYGGAREATAITDFALEQLKTFIIEDKLPKARPKGI